MKFVSLLAPGGDAARKKLVKAVKAAGAPVKFPVKTTWAERDEMVAAGGAEVAALCGLLYAKKRAEGVPLEALVAPVPSGERYEGKPVYYSDLVVAADSAFTSFEELRGAKLVINEEASFSGCAVVGDHLAQLGEERFFGHVVESGTHAASLQQVVHHGADVASIDSTVLEEELARDPHLAERIRVVGSLGPFPAPPVATRPLSAQATRTLRDAFVGLDSTPKGRKALQAANVERFVPVSDGDYDLIREAAERASQTPLAIDPSERAPHPFLDDSHTAGDLELLSGALDKLRQEFRARPAKARHELEGADGRRHRLILNTPEGLAQKGADLAFVGFFGLRRPGSDTEILNQLDAELTTVEFDANPGLLSYSTVELDGGRYFNLVLFKDAASVRQWRDGEKHDETVKTVSKTHYDAVRIHMGELKGGLEGPGEFIVRHTLRNEY